MDQKEVIQLKDDIVSEHFLVYKRQKYPIILDLFKSCSPYFQENQQLIERSKEVNIIDDNSDEKVEISGEDIKTFIKYVHREQIELRNDNVSALNYLGYKFEVQPLIKYTNQYIRKHQKEDDISFLLIHQNNKGIDTQVQEDSISKNFAKNINDDRLLKLKFPILLRIVNQYKKNNVINDNLIEFYFKCLDKYGSEASILFSDLDFKKIKSDYFKRITEDYSQVFDFHYIDLKFTKSIYETQNDILSKIEKHDEEIKQLKMSQTSNVKQPTKTQDDEINNLKRSILNLKNQQAKELKEMKDKYDEMFKQQNSKIEMLLKELKEIKSAPKIDKKPKEEENQTIRSFKKLTSEEEEDNISDIIKSGIIQPFGIRNLGNTCYMNSSLQCLLSLSTFICNIDDLISKSKTHELLSAFKSFISSHDPFYIKQIVSKKNPSFNGFSQQDSFEFTISFINAIKEELKKGKIDIFTGDSQHIIECPKCLKETPQDVDFISISLSIQNTRNILYIPFSLKLHPIKMTQKPELSAKIKTLESTYSSASINKYVLVAKDGKQFKPINEPDNQYAHVFAFELPADSNKKGYTIVQLKTEEGEPITDPFLCEVPLLQSIKKEELKSLILKRLEYNIRYEFKNSIDEIKQVLDISKPTTFPTKFRTTSKPLSSICTSYVNVKIYQNNIFDFKTRSARNQKQDLSLEQLFNSFVGQSQLEAPCKFTCEHCKKRARVFERTKLTKLPKVLIFHIKRTKDDPTDFSTDDTSISFPKTISIDTNGEYNKLISDPTDNGNNAIYEMVAISHHVGSFNGGHYWAEGKRGDKWYNLNDSQVGKILEPSKKTDSSYVTFYQQKI